MPGGLCSRSWGHCRAASGTLEKWRHRRLRLQCWEMLPRSSGAHPTSYQTMLSYMPQPSHRHRAETSRVCLSQKSAFPFVFSHQKNQTRQTKKLLSLLNKEKRKNTRSHSWDQQRALGTPHWVTFAPFLTVHNLCYLIFRISPSPHTRSVISPHLPRVACHTVQEKGTRPSVSSHLSSFFFFLFFSIFWLHHTACGILVPQPGIEPTSPAVEPGVLTPGLPGRSLSSIFPCVFRRTERCNRKAWLLTALPCSESSDHEGCLHPLISVSEPPSPHLLNGDICDVPLPPGLLASWAESLHRKSPGMQSPHGCARPVGHNGRWMECSWHLTTGSGFLILCGNAAWH